MFQRYVLSVISGSMLQVCLSGCCICSQIRCMCFILMLYMVAMVFMCFSDVFSSVSKACLKCFNCLQTYVATVVFGCFKSRLCVASLLPAFCYIVSPGAGRASIRRHCRILPNRRRRAPFLSCRSGGVGLAWSVKRSVARRRTSGY